jgi:hypothetical protein
VAIVVGILVLIDIFASQWTNTSSDLNQITQKTGALLVSWVAIVLAFALLLGFANVISVHWNRIRSQKPGNIYSVVLLVSLLVTLFVGFYFGPHSNGSEFIFSFVLQPLEATFFALLAIFIVTAAYRAFRIKDLESFFFVLFAVIVLLGQVPLGIYLWSEFPVIKDWILTVPTLAGVRGILLGVALGTIATGLRIFMGADRPYTD